MSEHSPEVITFDTEKMNHKNKVYFKIRAALPGDFEQFSSESLTEMIFDTNNGWTTPKLRDDLIAKFEESPRDFMIEMLERIKRNCDSALHYLQCKKCGIDLPEGEESE